MRVAAKLVSVLLAGIILIVAVEAYVSIRLDIQVFEDEMFADARQLGRISKDLVEDVWNQNGERRALELVAEANLQEPLVEVHAVRLNAEPHDPRAPRTAAAALGDVRKGELRSFRQRDEAGREFMFTYAPLNVHSQEPVALEIVRPLEAAHMVRRDTILRACLVALALSVTSGFAVVVLGVAYIGQPLNRLIAKTRRIGAGDLSGAITFNRRDEMAELARALNEMCEHLREARASLLAETEARVHVVEQLRHADRLTTVGRLSAGLAHELGTPLNVISARAGLICEDRGRNDAVADATIIRSQVEKVTRLVRQLLDFARQFKPQKSPQDLSELAARTAEVVGSLSKTRGVEISVETLGEAPILEVDAGQIQQVLTNLLVNAVQAMQTPGTVKVRLQRTVVAPSAERPTAPGGMCVRIDVIDDGPGIPAAHLDQIFDPFFTTKDVGEGTGLGLAIAHGIVQEHGGWLEVESQCGQGTVFSVYLPQGPRP